MRKRNRVLTALVAYLILSLTSAGSPQSISDVVKKGKKRKADTGTSDKVYTNQDLEGARQLGSVSTAAVSPGGQGITEEEPPMAVKEMEAGNGSSAWLRGATGYDKAMQERRRTRRPLLLYFYTDWCGYCRQFNKGILDAPEFKQYLKDVISVRVNPEAGPHERALARAYGVTGYPSFFVLPLGSDRARKMDRHRKQGEQWILMSPSAFVQACKEASGG